MNSTEIKKEISSVLPRPQKLPEAIRTGAEVELVSRRLLVIKAAFDALEHKRKSITNPINQGLREINRQFKAATEPMLAEETSLKQLLIDYNERERNAALKVASRQATRLRKKGEDDQALVVLEQAADLNLANGEGISLRRRWKARVVDSSKVPSEFAGITLRPIDQTALDRLAAASEGKARVPGVECYQDASIAASRKGA
jgi:hypothetical protein